MRKILLAGIFAAAFGATPFAFAGAPPSEKELEAQLQSPAQEKQGADYIVAHPDAVPPIDYILVVKVFLAQGNREKAAFWYYLYQIRIAPWRAHAPMDSPYPALTEVVGRPINEWAGSDFKGFRDLMLRASTYEAKLPLYPGRPDGVDAEQWQKDIAHSRATHDAATLARAVPDTPEMKEKSESMRKANGLYVGPWQSPGEPLPDDWR